MRNAVAVAVIASLLALACGGEPPAPVAPQPTVTTAPPPPPPVDTTPPAPPPAPPKKPLSEMQRAAGKTIAEALAAGDAKKFASVYAENATLKMAGAPDVVGRANIEKNLGELMKSFSKMKLGEQRVFVKKEVVVSEWILTGTHSGEFAGVKASEKPVGWAGASVIWFDDDGMVKEEHAYWNPPTVLFQVGASKEKNRAAAALPGGAPTVTIAQGSPAEDDNVKVVAALNEALEKKDDKKLGGMFVDKAEWDDITMPEAAKGKAAVLKYFKGLSTAFPDAKAVTTFSFGAGDWVVEEGTYGGTNNGPLFGAPATKKAMTVHELNIVQLDKDKKIVRAINYGNDLEMSSQLSPPKPAAPTKPATPAAPPAKK